MQVLLQGGAALYNNTGGDTTLHCAEQTRAVERQWRRV